MPPHSVVPREIAVPGSTFATLRRALAEEAGALPAIHALHRAGYAAGIAAAPGFPGDGGGDTLDLSEAAFWASLSSYFARRGWGTLVHEAAHEAVGTLTSADWAEAEQEPSDDASCSFATGFLSGLLSTLAGGPVAVLEVRCRARGDDACSFAFGNAEAIHEVYGKLLEGTDLSGALATL